MHFTYVKYAKNEGDLKQGDLLRRTDRLEAILREVHPHYAKSQGYRYFIVLTQSCDLVQRDGNPCSARYITIAAVRRLAVVAERQLEKIARGFERDLWDRSGFISDQLEVRLVDFMKRLYNNNETDHFFLYREPAVDLHESHCAVLHLSVALRAREHYDALKDARVLGLTESFQHKLGYQVGKIYSRVGTEDWTPRHKSNDEFPGFVREPLEDIGFKKIEKPRFDYVKRHIQKQQLEISKETVIELLKQFKKDRADRIQAAADAVKVALVDAGVEDPTAKKVAKRLASLKDFASRIK